MIAFKLAKSFKKKFAKYAIQEKENAGIVAGFQEKKKDYNKEKIQKKERY